MGIEVLNQPKMSNDFNTFNHSIADNMHQQYHSSSMSPIAAESRHPSSGSHQQLQPCNIDSRQNDLIAAELRRMQHAREEENNALLQLLGRQQQMAASNPASVGAVSSSHTSSSSITNHAYHNSMGTSASANGPFGSTQMGNFMNNSALDMNPMDHANFMSSSSMNGGMNGSNLDSLSGMAAMSSGAARQVSNSSNSSSRFNKQSSKPSASSAPDQFDSQVSNFMAAAFMNNTGANSGNMDSLGQMNGFLQQQKNQLGGPSSLGLGSMSNNAFGAGSTATAACENTSSQASSQEDPGWEEQYKSLRAYHMQNGHCKVPARFKGNAKLGRWVMTQRRQFTLLMQGFPSALTAERIRRLESLGFTWSVRPEPVTTWNKKFHELKAYKATFGNCMVPQRYQANPQLGTWVHTQRRQYKLMAEGKKSSMTKEKADALDSIGFFWAAKNCTSTTPLDSFDSRVHNSYEGSSSGDGHSPGAKAA